MIEKRRNGPKSMELGKFCCEIFSILLIFSSFSCLLPMIEFFFENIYKVSTDGSNKDSKRSKLTFELPSFRNFHQYTTRRRADIEIDRISHRSLRLSIRRRSIQDLNNPQKLSLCCSCSKLQDQNLPSQCQLNFIKTFLHSGQKNVIHSVWNSASFY